MRTIRNARVGEINCSKHFLNNKNRELFLDPGPLASFKHTKEAEAIFFLGDDLSKEKAEETKESLLGLRDHGVSQELIRDLILALDEGYAYVLMYSD